MPNRIRRVDAVAVLLQDGQKAAHGLVDIGVHIGKITGGGLGSNGIRQACGGSTKYGKQEYV